MAGNRLKQAQAIYAVDVVLHFIKDKNLTGAGTPTAALKSMHEAMSHIIKAANQDYGDVDSFISALRSGEVPKEKVDALCSPFFEAFIEKADPTKNRKYTNWICEHINVTTMDERGIESPPMRSEDIYKLSDNLRDFELWADRLKTDGKKTEIREYQNYEALENTLISYQIARDQKKADKEETQKGITTFYDGPEGKILLIRNQAAAQSRGAGTKWCIAAASDEDNMFTHYNKKSPIFYYLMPQKDKFGRQIKYAGNNGDIFDLKDQTLSKIPPELQALITSAETSLNPALAEILKYYGGYPHISKETKVQNVPASWAEEYTAIQKNRALIPDMKDPSLLKNPDFMAFLIEHDKTMIEYTDFHLAQNHEFVRRIVAIQPTLYKNLPYEQRIDEEISLTALRAGIPDDANDLWYAVPEPLREKRHIAQLASDKGVFIRYLPPPFQKDRDFLLRYVRNGTLTKDMKLSAPAIEKYENDMDFILADLKNSHALVDLSRRFHAFDDELKNDVIFLKKPIGQNPSIYKLLPESLQANRDLALEAVWNDARMYCVVPLELRGDSEILECALSENLANIVDAPDEYRYDPDYFLSIVPSSPIPSDIFSTNLNSIYFNKLEEKDPNFRARFAEALVESDYPENYLFVFAAEYWPLDPELLKRKADQFLAEGDTLLAFNFMRHVPERWPLNGMPDLGQAGPQKTDSALPAYQIK